LKKGIKRRDFIAGLSAVPIVGLKKPRPVPGTKPLLHSSTRSINKSESIRIGIIGFGFRGEQLAQALNLAHPDWIETQKNSVKENPKNKILDDYYKQENLNIELAVVCDVFSKRVERGITAGGKTTKGYKDYRELLASDEIDAVIISTPDHWHANMVIEAAKVGKHVYVEKCMTRTATEAVEVRDAVKKSGIVFQLGHQGRQSDNHKKAKNLIDEGILGKISLIETTTNRNNPFAAWVWDIPEDANPSTVDWELFQGPTPKRHPFSLERIFRWRCWWDYGTGLAGDLLTHEYDTVNSILKLGIPHSAIASGGIYYYKDGREVPDVFQANYEYPDRDLTLVYSGTLANGSPRGTLIMGHDWTMELGQSLTVWAESQSTRYKSRIEAGMIDPTSPIVNYTPSQQSIDAVSSATTRYFANRGLMYAYQEGRRVNTSNLHLKEWLNGILRGGKTSCNIDQGFQEAITAHMATVSYREDRKVYWDSQKEVII